MPFLAYTSRRRKERLADLSDRELLASVAADEEDAFDELVARKAGQLLQLAYRMVADREEARDLVQLAFVKAWENRHRYDPKWAPNTWLYRIATNLSIDFLRSKGSRERQDEPVRAHLHQVAAEGDRHRFAGVRSREVEAILEELLEELTERQRSVFVLRELQGMTSAEVADVLGCRSSTVRNHLFTARRTLRRELARRYPEYAPADGEEDAR